MAPSAGQSHRIVVHLPRHTEIWYSEVIPEVGNLFFRHSHECEVVSCRMEGTSYVLEIRETRSGPDLVDERDSSSS